MRKNILGPTELKHLKDIELLERVLDNAQVAIIITDINRTIERINAEFTKLFEYTAEEAVGKKVYDLVVPDDEEHRV